jgi:hypothetical protein
MLSTLLVIAGLLVGLFVLLAVIVALSARPAPSSTARTGRTPTWAADAGRPHPDAWSPLSTGTTSEMPAIR